MVPELRTCTVSYQDLEGITHTVEVSASSLYEAAVLGMKAFQDLGWSDKPSRIHGGRGEVAGDQAPGAGDQGDELRRAGSPREVALKSRLKELLGWND